MSDSRDDRATAEWRETPPPPEPTGDPLIDEVRQMKYEFAARFNHDLDRMFEYLRERQEELERREPGRIVRALPPRTARPDAPAA